MTKPVPYKSLVDSVTKAFPGLKRNPDKKNPGYIGTLQLTDTTGMVIDEYQIEIRDSEEPLQRFPAVFERGGRLKHNMDWHVYESSGQCCIYHQFEESFLLTSGFDYVTFIEKHVKPYFFNQTHRREQGYYLYERPHNPIVAGVQVLKGICKTNSCAEIIAMLRLFIEKDIRFSAASIYEETGITYHHHYPQIFRRFNKVSTRSITQMIATARKYKEHYGDIV